MSILKRYKNKTGGFESILKLIETSSHKTQINILESIGKEDPEYAKKIKNNLFIFDDILNQEERTLIKLFAKIPPKIIAYATYPCDNQKMDEILFYLDQKVKKIVKEEREIIENNINESLIGTAQKKIIAAARDLEANNFFKLKKIFNTTEESIKENKMPNLNRTAPESNSPEILKKEYKSINLELLNPNEKAPEDLYLFKNNKFILYRKNEELITTEDLENLKKHKITYLFVEIKA